MNLRGVTTRTPLHPETRSRCLSPEMIVSTRPATAQARNLSSAGSAATGCGSGGASTSSEWMARSARIGPRSMSGQQYRVSLSNHSYEGAVRFGYRLVSVLDAILPGLVTASLSCCLRHSWRAVKLRAHRRPGIWNLVAGLFLIRGFPVPSRTYVVPRARFLAPDHGTALTDWAVRPREGKPR